MNTPGASDRFFAQPSNDAVRISPARPERRPRFPIARGLRNALIAVMLTIAVSAGLLMWGLLTANAASDGFTYFPSPSATDGRMLVIAGNMSTLSGSTCTVSFSVPATNTTFQLGFFDGIASSGWDVVGGGQPLETNYTVFADPKGDGSGTTVVDQYVSGDMPANAWKDFSVTNTQTALAPSGRCFYYVRAWTTVPTRQSYNAFKIRVAGSTYITPLNTFGFIAANYAGITSNQTYDGTFSFYVEVPQGKTSFDLWDGDFDQNGDTDDPNTANSAIPTWSVTAAQTEGVHSGAPADDGGAAQDSYDRPPDVYYNVVLPDGSSFTNANPSGDREWELFRLGTSATATPAPDIVVPAVPAGLWHVDMVGLDVANLCALRFDSPVLGVDASGTIVRPQYPYRLGDRVWFDTNRNGVQDSGEASLTTGPIMTLRDGAGSFIETAAADGSGYYSFTTLPGTYTVDANDPSNYAPGGPLAGLMATTPKVLTSVVTTANNLALDFGFARGPALVVTKALASVLSTTAVAGEDTTYVVTVRNVGETTATSIVVTDTIVGADMTYVSGSTTASYTGGTSNADPVAPTASTLRWDFGASSKIASGGVLTLAYRVRVKAGAALGAHPDTIAAGAKDTSGTAVVPDASRWIAADTDTDDSAGASVWVLRPQLGITKTLTSSDANIQAGQSATFTIVVRNTGDSRVATVPLTDSYPSGNLSFLRAVPAPSGAIAGTLSWANVGPLDPGQQATVTVGFAASASPTGTVAADSAQAGPALDVYGRTIPAVSATASVAITRPQLTVKKWLSSPEPAVRVGESATFTVVVSNNGDTRIDSISLSDLYQNAYLTLTTTTPSPAMVTSSLTTYAVNASSTAGTWNGAANSLGGTTSTVATSGVPPFDMWHLFAAPAGMASIDGATITVRSRAVGGWGAANPDLPVTITRAPTADSQNGSWSIGGSAPATSRWRSIDDAPGSPDDDVTYVYPTGNTEYQASIAAPNVPAGATNIAVTATMRFRNTGDHSSSTWIRWRQGGNWRSTTGRDPGGTTYTDRTETLANPAGGAWTAAAVNLIDRLGLDNSDHSPVPYVTQLYLTVTYDLPQAPDDDTWGIQYSTNAGLNWTDIAAATSTVESTMTNHLLPLTNILSPSNVSGFRVRVAGTVVGSPDGTGTALWDTSRLDLTYKTPPSNGTLSWGSLGPLDPGQQTTVTMNFIASAAPAGQTTVDTATVAATMDANGDPVASSVSTGWVAVTQPGIAISKTRAPSQPATAAIGTPVRFQVLVTNTGNTTVTAASVVDTWSPTFLAYSSAVPAATSVGAGTATWTNLTPIAPGKAATLTVTYTTLAAGVALNRVHATSISDVYGDTLPDVASSAAIDIADTRVSVTKTRTFPDATIVVGQEATYTVVVKNTGLTTLATIPLSDTFMDADMDYGSASRVPSSQTGSSLTWNNVGPLAPGQQTTITIGLRAAAPTSGRSSIDTATVAGATDNAGVVAATVTATASVVIRWSARITALSASNAPETNTDVAITSAVHNDLTIPIINSTQTYIVWWDGDGSETFSTGDTYIDSSGNPHAWDGSTAVTSHVTNGINVAGGGTWTEPAPWMVNNANFPQRGTYNVIATWRESNGTLIDTATTQFFAIPALGWPLFGLTVLVGTAFMWFRLPAMALIAKRIRAGAR